MRRHFRTRGRIKNRKITRFICRYEIYSCSVKFWVASFALAQDFCPAGVFGRLFLAPSLNKLRVQRHRRVNRPTAQKFDLATTTILKKKKG